MSRPFDAARYAGLLEGLEATEVQFSRVLTDTATVRFDPEYFQKRHLNDAQHTSERTQTFCKFSDIGITVDASAFYPSIEAYYDQGNLPFLRVADVDSVIDFETCTRIPDYLCKQFPTLAKVKSGDIVFTKGGSVARVGLVTTEAAVSRDLIFLNSSKLNQEEYVFLYLYFQTGYFHRMLIRSSSQTAQPHLTITLVRELPIFRASSILKSECLRLVRASYSARKQSIKMQQDAEQTLLSALRLVDWQPPQPLSYVRSSHDAFTAGRFDAEHFKPKFAELITHIKNTGNAARLGPLSGC